MAEDFFHQLLTDTDAPTPGEFFAKRIELLRTNLKAEENKVQINFTIFDEADVKTEEEKEEKRKETLRQKFVTEEKAMEATVQQVIKEAEDRAEEDQKPYVASAVKGEGGNEAQADQKEKQKKEGIQSDN